MTPTEFTAALAELRLSHAGLCQEITELGGGAFNRSTPHRYANGLTPVPPIMAAYLNLRLETQREADPERASPRPKRSK